MLVQESFRVLKDMYEVSDEVYEENLKLFESLVNIKELYAKPVRQLSLGQRMLCEVTVAFLHNPKIVFLDEPTIGLDVAVKDSIRTLIKKLNEEKGTTIVLYFLWSAIYAGNGGTIAGMSLEQTYVSVSLAVCLMRCLSGEIDWEMHFQMMQGDIIVRMVKPVDYMY